MRMNTDGLVLRVTDVGESDRVLTILTKDYGVLRAFANGAKKLKSSIQSASQPLCYSRFSVYKNRDSYIIDDAVCTESFFRLREDIEKLSLAQYFCELAMELAPELEDSSEQLSLVLNCLHLLVTGKRDMTFLKTVAELRLLTLAGYMPDVSGCASCGCEPEGNVRFDIGSGSIFCEKCAGQSASLSLGVLYALRHICLSEPGKLFSFEMPDPALKKLAAVSESYLRSQVKHSFRSLEFYHSLMNG